MHDGRDCPGRSAASLGDRALARPTGVRAEPPRWGGFFRSRHARLARARADPERRSKGHRVGHRTARGRRRRGELPRSLPARRSHHRRRPHREDRQGGLGAPVPGEPFDDGRGPRRAQGLPPARPAGLPRRVDLPRRRVDRGAQDPRRAGEEDEVRPPGPGRPVGQPRVGDAPSALGGRAARPTADRVDRRRDPHELRGRHRPGCSAASVRSGRTPSRPRTCSNRSCARSSGCCTST
jgi:hypothetical protein